MPVGAVQWWLPGAALLHNQVAAMASACAALPNGWCASARHAKMRVLSMAHRFFFSAGCGLASVLSHDASAWSRSRRVEGYSGAPRSIDASVMMH